MKQATVIMHIAQPAEMRHPWTPVIQHNFRTYYEHDDVPGLFARSDLVALYDLSAENKYFFVPENLEQSYYCTAAIQGELLLGLIIQKKSRVHLIQHLEKAATIYSRRPDNPALTICWDNVKEEDRPAPNSLFPGA